MIREVFKYENLSLGFAVVFSRTVMPVSRSWTRGRWMIPRFMVSQGSRGKMMPIRAIKTAMFNEDQPLSNDLTSIKLYGQV